MKTRSSSGQKRNSSCKDINFPVKKRRCLRLLENSKISTGDLSKSPVKRQKPSMNLVTSTPIPHKISKTISRTPNRRNSNEIALLGSSKRTRCSITSSPILKTSYTTKSCEVRPTPLRSGRKRCPAEKKSNFILGSSKTSPKNQSHFSLNSSVEISERNVRSTRKSMTSQNVFKEVPDNLRSSRRSPPVVPQTALRLIEENLKKISVYQNEGQLHNKRSVGKSKDVRSVSAKSQKSIVKKLFNPELSQKSTDNLKGSRYSSRKPLSTVVENKSEKHVSHFPSTPKNNGFALKISKGVLKRQKKDFNVEVPQCSKANLIETNIETKSTRHSLRLQNKQSSNAASSDGLNSNSDRIHHVMAKIEKRVLKARTDNAEIPGRRLRSSTSNKTTKTDLSLKRSSRRSIPANKQKLTKNDTRELRKKPSKKQKKPTLKFQRRCVSYTEDIPLDDLSLAVNYHRRKVKSDGHKRQSSKLIFKRKLSAIEALKKADEDYEDDIFEGQEEKFEIFKDLLMDTSDSEKSFSVSSVQTPKFPITPHLRHKTPKLRFSDVLFSPTQLAATRKAALEYNYIRQKRREALQKMSSETPVMAETSTNRPDYSQALEEAQRLEENLQSLAAEDSDNDSYFSFG